MKKILLLLPLLLWACNKTGNLKPLINDSTSVKSSQSISLKTKIGQKTFNVDKNGVTLTITYLGNGVYDILVQCPYSLLRDDNDSWLYILSTGTQFVNKGRFFEFTTTLTPGAWNIKYDYTGTTIDGFTGYTNTFNITAQPPNPSAGWVSLYRYYNQYFGGHIYTNNWEELGSYSLDYQFEKVQGYMPVMPIDPVTLASINYIPNHSNYVPIYEFLNSTLHDYILSTNATAPAGYTYDGSTNRGLISNISTTQFNLALNEYVNSTTGQHVYTSPPENLSAPWAFSKVIGYLSSTPFTLVGNTPVSGNFQKTNCGPGYFAYIYETIGANTFYSDTQADANAEALTFLNANGTKYANWSSSSNCQTLFTPSTAAFNMRNTTSSGFTLTFSGSGSAISISLPAYTTSNLIDQIPFGTYTLTISPSGSPVAHSISLGVRSTVNAPGTTFTNVNISTGSTDLSLVIN